MKTLCPVSNLSLLLIFGSGIKKLPWIEAAKSEISFTSVIVASAPDSLPFRIIPLATLPKYVPCGWSDNDIVSTFKVVEVDE